MVDSGRRAVLAGAGGALLALATTSCRGPQDKKALARHGIIRTILEDIDPLTIDGVTLMHEHLGDSTDLRPGEVPTLARHSTAWMIDELEAARLSGIRCIVAVQTKMPPDATAPYLANLAKETGLHIVSAGAHFMRRTYTPEILAMSESAMIENIVDRATSQRLGMLGELGVDDGAMKVAGDERSVFRAFGAAQARTGLPLLTHTNYGVNPDAPKDMGLQQLDVLLEGGADPAAIAIGHMCCLNDPTAAIANEIANRGAYVAFDRVARRQEYLSDEIRVQMIIAMLEAGHKDRILISSDTSLGFHASPAESALAPITVRDGGTGYARALLLFIPMLRKAGVDEDTIKTLMVDNPLRYLTFTPKS